MVASKSPSLLADSRFAGSKFAGLMPALLSTFESDRVTVRTLRIGDIPLNLPNTRGGPVS
jgi:hypothetical protein